MTSCHNPAAMSAAPGWSFAVPALARAGDNGDKDAAAGIGTRPIRAWPWALAAAAVLGLLLALGLVVQNVVRQANMRHADTAAQSDALWRCNTVPGFDARTECRRLAATVRAATVTAATVVAGTAR